MEWKPVNSRLRKVRLQGKHINTTTTIQCYAPTNDSDEKTKDGLYDQLQVELQGTLKIITGELNAKVGNYNKNYNKAMEREGCGMNENGERLLELCTTYDLVIGGTTPHPRPQVHLAFPQWKGQEPDKPLTVIINGTQRRSLLDVRSQERS